LISLSLSLSLKAYVFIISCIALNQIMNDCHLLKRRF
jgi:hypothetical protein